MIFNYKKARSVCDWSQKQRTHTKKKECSFSVEEGDFTSFHYLHLHLHLVTMMLGN